MVNHLKEVEKLINHLRRVISDLVEDHDPDIDNVAWTVSKAREPLEKAKKQLGKLDKE